MLLWGCFWQSRYLLKGFVELGKTELFTDGKDGQN